MSEHSETQRMTPDEDEDRGRPGAEGGESRDTPPPVPDSDDDTPLGDTDQHSESQA